MERQKLVINKNSECPSYYRTQRVTTEWLLLRTVHLRETKAKNTFRTATRVQPPWPKGLERMGEKL